MEDQVKKTPNEPDAADLNPEIVRLAKHNCLLRQPMIMFLHGQLTWMEALEMMVTMMGKEYVAQRKILMETLHEVHAMPLPTVSIEDKKEKPLELCEKG